MVDIKVKDLKIAQKKAGKKALNSNKRAGLKTYVVKNDNVIEIAPDGKEKVIKKAEFKTVTSLKRKFVLKNDNKKRLECSLVQMDQEKVLL